MKSNFLKSSVVLFLGIMTLMYSCKGNDSVIGSPEGLKETAYKDFVGPAPKGAKTFKLHSQYPTAKPGADKLAECKWLDVDVNFDRPKSGEGEWSSEWIEYAKFVKDYVTKNIDISETGYTVGSDWYNLPWLASDPYTGREYSHGARYSFSVPLSQITKNPDDASSCGAVWGIANYNAFGGYAMGQLWSENGNMQLKKDPDGYQALGMPFPDGTVIHKINMIAHLPADKKPYHLKNAPTWDINAHTENPNCNTFTGLPARSLQPVHVFEMDIMVKDSRSPCGWVFIALVYNEDVSKDLPLWDRYSVMGVQFGMDSKTFPAVPETQSKPLFQTLLNPISENWTVGCNGRMATFQGSPSQNCMGCHQTSYIIEGTDKRGFSLLGGVESCDPATSDATYPKYFQNWKYPALYDGEPKGPVDKLVGFDFSLRLFDAAKHYMDYKIKNEFVEGTK